MSSGNKYIRTIRDRFSDSASVRADVYEVIEAFGVQCPGRQHAIKKLLCAGLRGKGNEMQDLSEARDAVVRAMELESRREKP